MVVVGLSLGLGLCLCLSLGLDPERMVKTEVLEVRR